MLFESFSAWILGTVAVSLSYVLEIGTRKSEEVKVPFVYLVEDVVLQGYLVYLTVNRDSLG